ncbi:MAG: 2Fe-2S iron-sulfur cluster-binding protein [Phreatobacter sp.]|uniref:2Fe-2S iron-sulfur cluster-binding protein n=1 Tax=Phreatobacter sp. TaxID=1966341 RepID=UPI002736C193|nr:2Fe-2S iron-sulfur cluster-binding protein [Phreatobacter sp.]MDP2801733.1 2Fe-2S iron-sulfur cluster-binding protein [Phreatobacter sp.]
MTAPLLLVAISAVILLQVAVGIGVGVWRLRYHASAPPPVDRDALTAVTGAWAGWRAFRVDGVALEDKARTQRTLILRPVDGLPLPDFAPGQYLTFSIDLTASAAEPQRTIVRCYSLSDQPNGETYRITVKRMPAPSTQPDLPAGAASNFLHDAVQVGDLLKVKAPSGSFMLDTTPDTPAVFIAGGIGVTPMISMMSWSLAHEPERRLFLFYGVRNSSDHAFKALLVGLAQSHPALTLVVLYGAPGPDDIEGRDFQQAGFIDIALLKRVLPHGRHQFYACGPPAMMAAVVPALAEWGVPKSDIHFESFGPASSGYVRPVAGATETPLTKPFDIQFRRSQRTIAWTGEDQSLLDFAERRGIRIEAGCRSGSCGACETRLVSGEVRYPSKPDFDVPAGACLLCVGLPASNLVLEA